MIPTYATIGKIQMHKDGFSQMTALEQKKYILSQFCYDLSNFTWTPKNSSEKLTGRLLELNLDTINGKCWFTQGTELMEAKQSELMIFANYAPNDPNIYTNHTSIKSILGFDLLAFVVKNLNAIIWTNSDQVESFLFILKKVQEQFYIVDDSGTRLNYYSLVEEQREGFPDPDINPELAEALSDEKKYKKLFPKKMAEYLNTTLQSMVTERQAYAMKIDGKFLHDSDYAVCYIDVLYYYIIGKLFDGSKNKGACHLCSENTTLANDISLKQKFYGTTNPLYFDNASNANSNLAFSMCKRCYYEITVGTQYAASKLKIYLMNMNALILPQIDFVPANPDDLTDPSNLEPIARLIRRIPKSEKYDSLKTVHKMLGRLSKFSLLYYHKPSATSQEFIINALLQSIDLESLVAKTNDLDELCEKNHASLFVGEEWGLSFEGLRYLILPSKESHPQLKPSEYFRINKSIIQLMDCYLQNRSFSFRTIVSQFIDIFQRKHINTKASGYHYAIDASPFIMMIYLEHLQNFNQLKGVPKMEGKTMTTILSDENILLYFANNAKVYQDNYEAQGLFILGMYLADVEREQRRKNISSTLSNRLNLRGIPKQKVKSVLALVDDMRNIWKTYNDPITDAYFRECLTDISSSTLSPEEIIFFILTGRAYRAYQAKMHSKSKENQEENHD